MRCEAVARGPDPARRRSMGACPGSGRIGSCGRRGGRRCTSRGVTYIWTLIAVAMLGAGLAAAARVWQTAALREREAELVFIGKQFRDAIGRYYESTSGTVKEFPAKFEDLLRDPRFPDVRRHLRKVYADPFDRSQTWEVIPGPGGRIVGVRSRSERLPMRQVFQRPDEDFSGKRRHADWEFVYVPGRAPAADTGAATSAAGGAGPAGGADAGAKSVTAVAAPAEPLRTAREDECRAQALADRAACVTVNRAQGFKAGAECVADASNRFRGCMADGGAR
jgi:hypothetical protein